MADPTSNSTETHATAAASGKAPGSMLGRLVILLFLVAVILTECLVAYMYLPGTADAQAVASTPTPTSPAREEPDKHSSAPAVAEEGESEGEEHGEQIEVDLEEFSVTAFQPSTNTSLRIEFHLYGTVAAAEEKEFQELMEKNVHRFREQVIVIVRGAELTDLTDAGLGLIKRRILEKTNRILGKPFLKTVIVSDFSFIEQ
jgi:flagellar FliL protein